MRLAWICRRPQSCGCMQLHIQGSGQFGRHWTRRSRLIIFPVFCASVPWFEGQKYFLSSLKQQQTQDQLTPVLEQAQGWLDHYFLGEDIEMDLPLLAEGTSFQKTVWEVLQTIPYGSTMGGMGGRQSRRDNSPRRGQDKYMGNISPWERGLVSSAIRSRKPAP